jgi:hypothetical protein
MIWPVRDAVEDFIVKRGPWQRLMVNLSWADSATLVERPSDHSFPGRPEVLTEDDPCRVYERDWVDEYFEC